jgi:hypothetical protein
MSEISVEDRVKWLRSELRDVENKICDTRCRVSDLEEARRVAGNWLKAIAVVLVVAAIFSVGLLVGLH